MASVPLLCHICPKRPHFSDISHLLTHVGSKGHLSHYFKAQVRSRQDPTMRTQLEIYDRWYDQFQIEKLLSQRMVLKESRDSKSKQVIARRPNVPVTNPKGAQRKPSKARITSTESSPEETHTEEVIDPQLSRWIALKDASANESGLLVSDSRCGELASRHRAHMPQMQQQRTPTPPSAVFPQRAVENDAHSKSGSVHEENQTPTSTAHVYPSPPGFSNASQVDATCQAPFAVERDSPNLLARNGLSPLQSATLKGVQWPGMDVFDSASPGAQRKRNQKKTRSIMEQMELNSMSVEPLEQIFWPEGELKKERLITGMVESSPLREESPKPKRRRPQANRVVLGELDANRFRTSQSSKNRKAPAQSKFSNRIRRENISNRVLSVLDSSPSPSRMTVSYPRSMAITEEAMEWSLNAGKPTFGNEDEFLIFDEETEVEQDHSHEAHKPQCRVADYSVFPRAGSDLDILESRGLPSSHVQLMYTVTSSHARPHEVGPLMSSVVGREATDNLHAALRDPQATSVSSKENLEPVLGRADCGNERAVRNLANRVSQRYFSVCGGHPPQFFDILPPQMEFGGTAEPIVFGSAPNPLNRHTHARHVEKVQDCTGYLPS